MIVSIDKLLNSGKIEAQEVITNQKMEYRKGGLGRGKGVVSSDDPLPSHIRKLREMSISLFVSNLPEKISVTEVKAMFL